MGCCLAAEKMVESKRKCDIEIMVGFWVEWWRETGRMGSCRLGTGGNERWKRTVATVGVYLGFERLTMDRIGNK